MLPDDATTEDATRERYTHEGGTTEPSVPNIGHTRTQGHTPPQTAAQAQGAHHLLSPQPHRRGTQRHDNREPCHATIHLHTRARWGLTLNDAVSGGTITRRSPHRSTRAARAHPSIPMPFAQHCGMGCQGRPMLTSGGTTPHTHTHTHTPHTHHTRTHPPHTTHAHAPRGIRQSY